MTTAKKTKTTVTATVTGGLSTLADVKDIEVKQPTALSKVEQDAADQANGQDIITSDVLIPRLLLMQGISPLVAQRKAQIADMVRSTTGEKLGNPEKPVDLVPLKMENVWLEFETAKSAGTTKPAYRGTKARTAKNEGLDWEFKGEAGQEMFRCKGITLYALVPSDIQAYDAEIKRAMDSGEAPDLSRTVLPLVMTFQKTSFKHAGKKCASFFNNVRVNALRMPTLAPFQYILPLSCKEEKDGDLTWYVFDLGTPKPLKDKAVREEAARWVTMLGKTSFKTDDAEAEVASESQGSTVAQMEV